MRKSRKSPKVEKTKVNQVKYLGDFPSFYSNHTEVGISPWDIRLTIGEVQDVDEKGLMTVKSLARIHMSPLHAKSVLKLLEQKVAQQEQFQKQIETGGSNP